MSDEILSKEEIDALIAEANAAEANGTSDANETAQPPAKDAAPDPPLTEAAVKLQPDPVVRQVEFSQLGYSADKTQKSGVDLILDVQVQIAVELGRTTMQVRDVLGLGPGSVVELDKHAGEPVEVVVNNKIVARGEVVIIDENFGVRITEIMNAKGGKNADTQQAA